MEFFCRPFCSEEVADRYQAALNDLVSTWNLDMEKVKSEGKVKLGLENES